MDAIASFFKLSERGTNVGTEAKAGLTTFMVMAYIIFVNPSILTGGFKDADPAFTFPAIAAATALVAGLMTIAMGVFANYPFALAAGLGINAIVAFTLTAKGLSPAGAMGVIVIEGIARHRPRAGRAPRGHHERRPARAEAGHRRRHRPLHPVHRLRQRRLHQGRQRHARHGPVPDHDSTSSSFIVRACSSRSCSVRARCRPRCS